MLSLQHAKTTVPAPRPIVIHASYYVRARPFLAAAKPKEFERFPVLDISIPDSTSLNPKLTNLSSARRISLAIHNSPFPHVYFAGRLCRAFNLETHIQLAFLQLPIDIIRYSRNCAPRKNIRFNARLENRIFSFSQILKIPLVDAALNKPNIELIRASFLTI